jgi:hypothetical protein
MWYDRKAKNYFAYDGKVTKNITAKIKVPLYDEENDTPDYPSPYGVMGWHEGDSAVYVYDRYDIWKVDPLLALAPINYLNQSSGRKNKITTRYVSTDPEKRFFKHNESLVVRRFSNENKKPNTHFFSRG